MYTHTYLPIRTQTRTHNMHLPSSLHLMYTCTATHTHARTHIHTYTRTYIHNYTRTQTHIYTHTFPHTMHMSFLFRDAQSASNLSPWWENHVIIKQQQQEEEKNVCTCPTVWRQKPLITWYFVDSRQDICWSLIRGGASFIRMDSYHLTDAHTYIWANTDTDTCTQKRLSLFTDVNKGRFCCYENNTKLSEIVSREMTIESQLCSIVSFNLNSGYTFAFA